MKKTLKRTGAFILALVMVLGSFTLSFAAEVPEDVYGSDLSMLPQAVEALMDAGSITGDTDGLFHPLDNLTRAQVCCMLIKLANPPAAELVGTVTVNAPSSNFVDLTGYKNWAGDYINYAANHGIAMGIGGNMFAPGSNVTLAELVTFTVRTAGIKDDAIGGTWPANYIAKAVEMGLFKGLDLKTASGEAMYESEAGIAEMRATKATKEQAAIIIYNAMAEIAKANKIETQPQGTNKDKADNAPVLEGLVFADAAFDTDMTTYAGKTLASDVKVYVYGIEKEYSKTQTLPTNASEYVESNVFKYKNTSTPAWYKLENGKITQLILPGDVGFSGKVYCVINDVNSKILNYEDESVIGIETLTAGREITWFGMGGFTVSPYTRSDYFDGSVFELYTRDGEVRQITKIGDAGAKGKKFEEIDLGAAAGAFAEVADKDNSLLKIDGYGWVQVKKNAAVYVLNKYGDEYEAGSLSKIHKGDKVRLYDISDDDENAADIIVVQQN